MFIDVAVNFISPSLARVHAKTRVILIGGSNQIARKNVSEALTQILKDIKYFGHAYSLES
jgi:heptaprenylglyceryl phosphate synthase